MRKSGIAALSIFAAVYAAALYELCGRGSYPLEEALAVLAIMGLGFPALGAVLLWRAASAAAGGEVARRGEWLAIAALLLFVCGYLTFGATLAEALAAGGSLGGPRAHALYVLVRKLAVFVLVPWLVLHYGFGRRAADLGLGRPALAALWGRQGLVAIVMGLAGCAMQFVLGSGATALRQPALAGSTLVAALGGAFAWNLLEAGLVEEFFFRAVLQTRLAAALRSPLAGALGAALLFGLAHAPGYVLRGAGLADDLGTQPGVLQAAAYAVAVPALAALPFALLWARTRNLYVVMIVHAAIDTLPFAAEFARTWLAA
ncbi:MAG: CPBP family intramembrane metalloprotease [Proteobacteria bacterium]|nr:CPBP family intramembrane metalloprotease [Pseudomonadota bacterium]